MGVASEGSAGPTERERMVCRSEPGWRYCSGMLCMGAEEEDVEVLKEAVLYPASLLLIPAMAELCFHKPHTLAKNVFNSPTSPAKALSSHM